MRTTCRDRGAGQGHRGTAWAAQGTGMGSSCKALTEPTWAALGPWLLALGLRQEQETSDPCRPGASLPPWPCSAAWQGPPHAPALAIAHPHMAVPIPGRALSKEGGTASAWPGAGAQALALCITETHPALLGTTDTLALFVPSCHHCLQCSGLRGTWGHFLSRVPQWDPLKLQETLEFQFNFDFLRSFLKTLSGTESDENNTKVPRGSLKSLCCFCAAEL